MNLDSLRARVAELEAQNRELTESAQHDSVGPPRVDGPRKQRWRAVVSGLLIVVGLILAPLAVLGPWVRAELVDTDQFVATFAPLVEHAEVQGFIADQAMTAFDDNVPVKALVGELFDGLTALDLPPKASAALSLLEGPAAAGVRSIVESGVSTVVASPQFSTVWENALRETHSRTITVLQGHPGALVSLSHEGVLSLNVGEVTGQIKSELQSRGIGVADAIPTIDRTIIIVSSDALATVRSLYLVAVSIGFWIPYVVLGLLVVGVAIARKRARTIAWTAAGTAASLLILASGVGIGRAVFVSSLSPSIMSAEAARAIYEQVISRLVPTIAALVLVALIVMVAAWLAGGSRRARALRGIAASASDRAHRFLDAHGLDTRKVGHAVERWHSGLVVLVCTAAMLVVLFARPLSVGLVAWTVAIMCLLLVVVELVRRPAGAEADATVEPVEPIGSQQQRP